MNEKRQRFIFQTFDFFVKLLLSLPLRGQYTFLLTLIHVNFHNLQAYGINLHYPVSETLFETRIRQFCSKFSVIEPIPNNKNEKCVVIRERKSNVTINICS